MTEVYIKLMGKGLKHHEHEMFPYQIDENMTLGELVESLHEDYGERFDIYLDDSKTETRTLRKDAIVIVNGANMVTKQGLKTKLSKGDLVVFMIAAVGG